jgi:IMP dehydrogenase
MSEPQQRTRVTLDEAHFPLAITFDDVLLQPKYSNVQTRRGVSLKMKFTRKIELNNPIVASNMDTVTEAAMAVAMSRNGGIGVLHRFLSIEEQVGMVRQVKRAESFVVDRPFCCPPGWNVAEVREAQEDLHGVGSFLVTNEQEEDQTGLGKELLGIVTTRDLQFAQPEDLVKDIMTPKERLVTASPTITHADSKALLRKHRLEKLPLVDQEFCVRGLITAKDIDLKVSQNEDREWATVLLVCCGAYVSC